MKKITNQHGDVIITKVSSLPKNCKKINCKNGFVIEKGEGPHTHTIENVDNVELFSDNTTLYMKVLKDIEIDHQEHGIQTITPGIYRKDIERQFDYENEIERRVLD
jgi:hypothetical protein